MTALSKEDVVSAFEALESLDDFARMDTSVAPIGQYKVLRKFIETCDDLVAENERLSKLLRIEKIASDNCSHKDEADKLRTALAAAEARGEKLREGIDAVQSLIESSSGVYGLHMNGDPSPWSELLSGGRYGHWLCEFSDALDLPRDDSALREMIAWVYEECAKVCDEDSDKWTDYSCEIASKDCANKIRTLAENLREKKC